MHFKDQVSLSDWSVAYLLLFGTQWESEEGLHKGRPDVQQLLSRFSGAHPVLDDLVDVIVDLPAQIVQCHT